MSIISNPHDHFFKETFGDVEVVKQFAKHYIPERFLRIIDINTLAPLKDSFVQDELVSAYSDLLFSIRIGNREGYVYFLFEHKSYPENDVALQLLGYMTEIWKQARRKENIRKLPYILPIVFYQGNQKWANVMTVNDLLGYDETNEFEVDMQPLVPNFEFLFYDFSPRSTLEIKGNEKLQAYLMLIRDILNEDIDKLIKTIAAIEQLLQQNMRFFEKVIIYFFTVRDEIPIERVQQKLTEEGGRKMKSFADKLREEGMEKRELDIIQEMLKLNIDESKIIQAAKISPEKLAEIKQSLQN